MRANMIIAAFLVTLIAVWPINQPSYLAQAQSVPRVAINELAWSGTASSSADEWIEIKNNTSTDIDLTGWTLSWGDADDKVVIHFVAGQENSNTKEVRGPLLPARGFFLLERSDDDAVRDITADVIYTRALRNEGEVVELRDAGGTLVDTANKNGAEWPAGTTKDGNVQFASMERINSALADEDFNWGSNNGTLRNGRDKDGNLINGTPRAENSLKSGN